MPRQRIIDICLFLLLAGLLCYEIFILKGNNYYVVSLIIILAGMMRFLLSFEKSHPSVQMMAVIAALCGLAIASRIAFIFLPQIKPMAAVVIITGIVFGGEAGFITGAVTAFVSNFYFGQGSWTPFQMFSWGFIGWLAGALNGKKLLEKPLALCIYGVFAGAAYSVIMEVWTTLSADGEFSVTRWGASMLAAMPVTLIYCVSNSVFLLLLRKPVGKRLERLKTKFAVFEYTNIQSGH